MANLRGDTVSEFASGSTTPTATLTGLSQPCALAFDSHGNLYVANKGYGAGTTVSEFAPGSTVPTATLTGVSNPSALKFDASGNLYVANYIDGVNDTVSQFSPGATTPTATLTGLRYPTAMACDSSGNLYVADLNGVSEFAPGGTTAVATLAGLDDPKALVFDSHGNLYVANSGFGRGTTVSKFVPGSTAAVATLIGVTDPVALVFDPNGNLFVANYVISTVSEFKPSTMTTPTSGGVVVRASLPTLPMSLGGANDAVAGVNLTDAELAQIQTTAIGTLTFGDSAQIGDITFTMATPATTAGTSIVVVQASDGPGRIVLEGDGTDLNGNGGTVALTSGASNIVAPLSPAGAPLITQGFNATGLTLTPTLDFAPRPASN